MENRIKSKEGLNYAEFSYQAFQAYDWFYLLDNHDCTLQIGGNDQTGNITTGQELISKLKPEKKVFGITLPIITSEKGDKLGKSTGNAVWLDSNLFSPFEFYQFFFNTADQMVESYLKLFTFLPLSEIDDLMNKHLKNPETFSAQKKLASELTLLVHGEEGLNSALKCTNALFYGNRESMAKMSENEIKTTFKGCSNVTLAMDPSLTVLDVALKAKCFRGADDAIHIIQSGGFRINSNLCRNPNEALVYGQHILINNISLIRVGKKNHYLVKWVP